MAVVDSATGAVVAGGTRVHPAGLFVAQIPARRDFFRYRLRAEQGGAAREFDDIYRFPPVLGELDLHLLGEGNHWTSYEKLGAHPIVHDGVAGVAFAVWAPNARRVSVVGDFNDWDGRRMAMRNRQAGGVWELFVPDLTPGHAVVPTLCPSAHKDAARGPKVGPREEFSRRANLRGENHLRYRQNAGAE